MSELKLPDFLSWEALVQYEAIRRLGQTNMLDKYMVQRIAFENGFYELVSAMENKGFYEFLFKHYGEVLREMKEKNMHIPIAKPVKIKFELEDEEDE